MNILGGGGVGHGDRQYGLRISSITSLIFKPPVDFFVQFLGLIEGFRHHANGCALLRLACGNFFDAGFNGNAADVGELG
jgi:hypothetical protein